MSGLLIIAVGMVPVAALIAFISRTVAKDRRRNAFYAGRFSEEFSPRPPAVSVSASAATSAPARTTSPAIAAPSTPKALPVAEAARPITAPASATPAPAVPPLGARIRIEDGRTGEVIAVERIARATRVHLRLDDGASGHVDIPDAAQPGRPAQPARTHPAATRAIPAASAATPVPATAGVGPVTAAVSAPGLLAGANAGGRVRLGGFSVPLAPAERARS